MPYKVTLPPGEPTHKPVGVSPIPEKAVPAVPTGSGEPLSNPKARLWRLLDTWASMDESAWPEANVRALSEDIMDIFMEHSEAESWFRDWRTAHPEARLC